MGHEIGRRKDQHLDLCLNEPVEPEGASTLLDDVRLIHDALPELAVDGLSTGLTLLGRSLSSPLMVVGMTGGTPRAGVINRALARAAQTRGVAFGVGSQRAMLKDGSVEESYRVRDVAPDVLLFGNIGAQQLAQMPTAEAVELMARIGADALFVHLNPAQELAQPGGDRSFVGCFEAIARLAGVLGPRVWVKETGCGLSRKVAKRLVAAGVGGLDVSGAGGTSWTRVEALRATGTERRVGDLFSSWGIPTAAAVAASSDLGVPIVASGGLRSGLDVAKALVLGGTLGGMALPYLKAQERGGTEAVEEAIAGVESELRAAMLLTGSGDLAALRQAPRLLTGTLPGWIAALREGA